ncbi:MAG: hypothetical protein WCJ01_00930 [Ignavibacteria bacterium]
MSNFPDHDPYASIISKISGYFGYNVELIMSEGKPISQSRCSLCVDINERIQVLLDGWQPFLEQVRDAYRQQPNIFNYDSRYHRAIYMLSYFPFYIEPVFYSLNSIRNSLEPAYKNITEINVAFLGGGPLPELIGIGQFFQTNFPNIKKINATLYDKFTNWDAERENITIPLLKKYFCGDLILQNVELDLMYMTNIDSLNFKNTDLLIFQNTISDIVKKDLLKVNLNKIWDNLPGSSKIVIIDLYFSDVYKFLTEIKANFLEDGGKLLLDFNQTPKINRPNIPLCHHLEEILYSTTSGLIPKRVTKYYHLIIEK